MMYGTNMRSGPTRAPAVNERMRVSKGVRLPGGDVDMVSSMPLMRNERLPRVARSLQRKDMRTPKEKVTHAAKANMNTGGMTLSSFAFITTAFAVVLGMVLLFQLSDMMEKNKEVAAIQTAITKAKARNEQLEVDLAAATRETDVWYSASQRLGLIAGKGAESVYIQVPQKYLDVTSSQELDVPPVQNGSYAALLGFME